METNTIEKGKVVRLHEVAETVTEDDDVSLETLKTHGRSSLLMMCLGAALCVACQSVVPALVLFAGTGVLTGYEARKHPLGSADRRFVWLLAITWMIMAVLATIGFASRFWG